MNKEAQASNQQVTAPTVPSRWANAENLYKDLPPVGTVIGQISGDLFDQIRKLSNRIDATKYTKESNEGIQLAEQWREVWTDVCKKLDVPYAWPLSFEWTTGKVFIIKD